MDIVIFTIQHTECDELLIYNDDRLVLVYGYCTRVYVHGEVMCSSPWTPVLSMKYWVVTLGRCGAKSTSMSLNTGVAF